MHLATLSQHCQISWTQGDGALGSSGWLCLAASFLLHCFLNLRGWFYRPADCSTCGVKCMPQLRKVASAALEHIDSSAYVLGGQEASRHQGQRSSHPCTHPVSLQVRSPAAEHLDSSW